MVWLWVLGGLVLVLAFLAAWRNGTVGAGAGEPPGWDRWFVPLVGETLHFARDTVGFLSARQRRYGNVFHSHLFGQPTLVLIGAEAFAFLYEEERKGRIVSANAQLQIFKEILGDKILNEREDHSFHRAMVTQPILGRSTLQAMLPKMQANLARRVEHWVTLGTFEWYTQIKEWAFDNASALVWGSDISQPSDERHRLFEIFESMNKGLGGCLPIKLPGTQYSKCLESRRQFGETVGALVEERSRVIKQKVAELRSDDPLRRIEFKELSVGDDLINNYLFALIKAQRELPVSEVVDIIAGLYFAAHHTVTSGLTNIMVALEQRPDVRQKVVEEQETVVGDSEDRFTYEQLNSMVYLQKVIKETMRLVPPATGIIRKVGPEDVEYNGYTLKAGRSIYANIILTQRDPNHFTDPETFDPERFSLDRAEDQKAKFAWVVFGGGGHSCLGMKLALLELKMMTSYLVRDYDWQAVPGQDMRIEWAALSPSPKDLYKVRFWQKKQPSA